MDDSISLRELIDADIVQAIQDSFAKTVGVSSVIFLPDGDALTRFSNPTKFCSLIQSTKEGRRRCFQSFAEMSRKAAELSKPEIMYCFAYGAHFVAPIIIDGKRKATMYAGQFRPDNFSPEQLKELEKIAVEIDLDPEPLVKEAKNMRMVGDDMVLDCLHSFIRTVKGIAELGAQALELRQAKDALQKSHDELELRVQERTAELTGTNKELRREVAERKSAEDALRESEARIRALLNAPTDAMILMDSAGIILAINNIHVKWFKKSIDELIGTCIFDLFPSDIAEFRKAQVNVVFNTGKPIHFKESQNEKIYHTNVYPVFGAKGKVTAVAVYAQDITERKQAESALWDGKEKLRSIVEQSSDGVVLADEGGTTIEWNRGHERITGLSRAEVLGKPVWDVMFQVANEHDNPALYEQIKAGVLKILETGQSEWLDWLDEMVVRRPDGARRVIQVAVFPIKTCKGFMAGAISRDITEYKRAEDALRKSEEKYRVLFEMAKDAIFLSDDTGKFVDVNQAACESLGYSREELLRLSNREIDTDPTGYDAFLKVRDTPAKEAIFEVNQQKKDGTLRPVEITGKFFKVAGERLSLAIARDITERKLAEEVLRGSEEKLRSIVEQSGDGIMLADEQGNIIEWNRGHERITGLSRAEVLGKPVWDIMFQVAATEHDNPASYERIKAGVLNILETGQSGLDRLEGRDVQCPDGVRRVIQVAVFPIKTGKGFMAGAISRDITGYKRAEYALRKSEEKYRALFEMAKDAIFLSDDTGKFVDVNQAACESLGYSREELLRLSNREIDTDPTGYDAFLKVRDTPAKEAIFEVNQQKKDGTLRPVEITRKFFKVAGERLYLAIARDITERKSAEEQIKRSLREKDVLIPEIHHRVKNNLQVVSSLLSMQARTTRNKEAIDALSKSQSRINTMAIIHTKLYESGDLSELNMKEFVGTLSEQLFRSYLVNDTKIARIVHVTDHKFPVSVGVHIGLIINELLSNSLEHAFGEGAGGKIEVSLTAPDSGRVNLRVSDDGAGLPPGFDINSTKTLGLHLVKILVEDQLQGTLEVISDGGVTFNMEFDIGDKGGSSYGESKNTDR